MLGQMNAAAAFAGPGPVAISIPSVLSRDEVIDRLAQAVDERRYSSPGRSSPGFFRLGGSVMAEHVVLTARPYVIPGVIAGSGAMTMELRGEVIQAEEGSEIRGTVSAPIRFSTLAFAVFTLITWVVCGLAFNGSTSLARIFILLGAVSIGVVWAWTIRRNRRMALRNVDELTRMIRSIVADSTRGPGDINEPQGVLTDLAGASIASVGRQHYVYRNKIDRAKGPIELTFRDGRLLRLECGADGEALAIFTEPWVDPFRGPLSPENAEFVARSGKWTQFDVSADSLYSAFIGSLVTDLVPIRSQHGKVVGVDVVRQRGTSTSSATATNYG
jgi:hypothetical protein